jgi:hypothetical protein
MLGPNRDIILLQSIAAIMKSTEVHFQKMAGIEHSVKIGTKLFCLITY